MGWHTSIEDALRYPALPSPALPYPLVTLPVPAIAHERVAAACQHGLYGYGMYDPYACAHVALVAALQARFDYALVQKSVC